MNAEDIKHGMIVMGAIENPEELSWLTDEYIEEQKKLEKEYPAPVDHESNFLAAKDYGNHFYTSNNGKRWHWKSGYNRRGGNLNCGQNESWYYDVRRGDSYVVKGTCSGGYSWYEFNIYN